jgi:hypothetical protein
MHDEKSPQDWPAHKKALMPQQNKEQDHDNHDHEQQRDPALDGAWLIVVGGFVGCFATFGNK